MAALVLAACSTPLASPEARISRCMELLMQQRVQQDNAQQQCTAWEQQGALKDDGQYVKPDGQPAAPPAPAQPQPTPVP